MSGVTRGTPLDRLMRPIHHWVWADTDRRLRKLLTFADSRQGAARYAAYLQATVNDSLYRHLIARAAQELNGLGQFLISKN